MHSEAFVVAQPSCKAWDALPQAAKAAHELATSLAAHGYCIARPDLLADSDKPEIEAAIGSWLASVPADARLILYWTGHGSSDGGSHYLVCRGSPRTNLSAFTAIEASALGAVIANCQADKILVIVDTCYSGQGAAQIASVFSRVLATRVSVPGRERAFAVIASAHPLQKVPEARFCKALQTVLFEPNAPRRWSDQDEYIHSEFLARAVGRLLPEDSLPEYKADGIGQEFIPNPRYRPGLAAEVVEEQVSRRSQPVGAEHFALAARGVEIGEKGSYFSGRVRLLRALVDWLGDAEHGIRIVTGPPGSGKSAVLGRLAALSGSSSLRKSMLSGIAPGASEGTVPPLRSIDVAIYAKGSTLDDCAHALARQLRTAASETIAVDVERLVAEIGKLDQRLTLMIDGLDEAAAAQGAIIASSLVVPLARLPKVRVLVGTRRSLDGAVISDGEDRHVRLRAAFGPEAAIDDLEDEPDARADIAAYVRQRLADSRHRDDPAVAATAERVAARADGIFLYARIVARTLQDQDRLEGELPATAVYAFAADLAARFGANQPRIDDLLAALAWGEGKGLTRRVWPQIANALAAREHRYGDDDVAWALGHAGWHIVEAGEEGQAVYRLAHRALADHYRNRVVAADVQARIVEALRRGMTGAGWLDSDRYVRRHLADHAVQSGGLEALIEDPGYLAVADPTRLVAVLPDVEGEVARRIADLYDRVADRLLREPMLGRLPLLHLTAQIEAPDLAPRLDAPVATRWRCRWACMRPSTPHRVIGRHPHWVLSVAMGIVEGRAVVVSGGDDRTLRLWDARTGSALGGPLQGHYGWVRSVAIGAVGDRMLVVSGSDDETVRLWDAGTGRAVCELLPRHRGPVTAVAFGIVDDRPVVVSASRDGSIHRWNALTQEMIGEPITGHQGTVSAIAAGVLDGMPVLVSGGWDETIRLWRADDGHPVGEPMNTKSGWIHNVAFGIAGDPPIIVFGSRDSTVGFLDARTCQPLGDSLNGHTDARVALGKVEGRSVVAYKSRDRTIRLCDAGTRSSFGEPLRGHSGPINGVAFGAIGDRAVVVTGSQDRTIRLWDLRMPASATSRVIGHSASVNAVAFDGVDGRAVVATGSWDRTVRRWDAQTGDPIGAALEHAGGVNALLLAKVDHRSLLISASDDGSIRRWDAGSGDLVGEPLLGHKRAVLTLAFGVIDDLPIIFSGGEDRTLRRWNARTGEPIQLLKKAHHGSVTALVLGFVGGRPVVVSGSHDKTLCLRDARTGGLIGKANKRRTARITSLAMGQVDGRPVIVSGGRDSLIYITDPATGASIGRPLAGHTEGITAVALVELQGRAVVMSSSLDGTLRSWDAKTAESMSLIDVGMPIEAFAARIGCGIALATTRGVLFLDIDVLGRPSAGGGLADQRP